MIREKKYSRFFLFLIIFVFTSFIMWCSPMVSDDYEFAAKDFPSAADGLSYVLHYGNGRLLGNLSAITMVKFPQAAVFFKALVVTSVIFLLPAVLGMKKISAYLLSFLLLMGLNDDVFGEVYAWTSGFGNYLPPIWITLLILYLIKAYPNVKSKLLKGLLCGIVFVLGAASQLFVEHTTLINILLSAILTVKELRSEKKERAVICCIWTLATLMGAAAMFAIPKVFYLEHNRSEGYRSVHMNSVMAMIFSAAKNTMRFSVGYLGTMGSVLCLGGWLTVWLTKERRSEKWNSRFFWICAVSLIYQIVSILASAEKWHGQLAVLHHILSTVMVIPPLFVWILGALRLESKALRNGMVCILALAFVSLCVLLPVSPVPARVIYQSYVFVAAAFLLTAREAAGSLPAQARGYALKGLCVTVLALVLVLGCVFLNIQNMIQIRDQHVADAKLRGEETVEIFRLPYDYVFWENAHGISYEYHYDTPGDLKLVVIDFDCWCSKYLQPVKVD